MLNAQRKRDKTKNNPQTIEIYNRNQRWILMIFKQQLIYLYVYFPVI